MSSATSAQHSLASSDDQMLECTRKLQSMYRDRTCQPGTQEIVGTFSQVRVWISAEHGSVVNIWFRGTVADFANQPEACVANVCADANIPMRPLSAVAAEWHRSEVAEVEASDRVSVEVGGNEENAGVEVSVFQAEDEAQVHQGFLQAYMEVDPFVMKEVASYAEKLDQERLIVRLWGHSLGGAMATLAAVRLKRLEGIQTVEVFTFGSPRVGNAAFRKLYRDWGLHETTLRFAHVFDPVPYLPPTSAKDDMDHSQGWSLPQDFAKRISSSLNVNLHYVHVCEARPMDRASTFAARLPAFMAHLANMRSNASMHGSISKGLLGEFLSQHSIDLYCQNVEGDPERVIVGSSASAFREVAMLRFPISCGVLQAIHLQTIQPGLPSITMSEHRPSAVMCPYCNRETVLSNPACLRVACDHADCGKRFGTGVITKRAAGLYQTLTAVKPEGSVCATGLTSVALAAARSEASAGTAARALAPLVARGAVQAASLPSAVAAMVGGHVGQKLGHAKGGERGGAIGEFSGNVGCGAAAGAAIAGAPGAAVGASVGIVGWGISKGVRLVFPSRTEEEQEHRAVQMYLGSLYRRSLTRRQSSSELEALTAGAAIAGAPGATLGASLEIVRRGISKGISLVFPSRAEEEQERRAVQVYLGYLYSRSLTRRQSSSELGSLNIAAAVD